MSGDPIDLDVIEARARAATPGPWESDGLNGQVCAPSGLVVDGIEMWAETDAQHIAGMDPATTLALVAEARRLRATNARLNRRCQIAEAAINELTTTTGRGRVRPVAAEVWERCQRSHNNAHHPADATEGR